MVGGERDTKPAGRDEQRERSEDGWMGVRKVGWSEGSLEKGEDKSSGEE